MASLAEFTFTRKPSLFLSYTRGLFRRRNGIKDGEKIPELFTSLKGLKFKKRHLEKFNIQCGLAENSGVSILYPMTLVFPVFMRMMSHRRFPFKYVTMLQLRNHIIYHKQININDKLDMSSKIIAHRQVKKGIEIDTQSLIEANGKPYWESVNTYFFPKRSKSEIPLAKVRKHLPLSDYERELDLACLPRIGWKWAGISGDYNGIHYSKTYAKMMGFKSDFIHPHRLLTHILYRCSPLKESPPQRLNIVLKGPVFYDTGLKLKIKNTDRNTCFDLYCGDNPRPSICVETTKADVVIT